MTPRFGPYELVRKIADGGMAEIYLARTVGIAGFEKYFALKMIHRNHVADTQFVQMLIDEANICVRLDHRNIVQTFDLGKVDDRYYITMEYVDGVDLFQLVKRCSDRDIALPFDACAFVAREIALGLAYAHRKTDVAGKPMGIVHRDVSPPNVLISRAGDVKLIDFGIAKMATKSWQTQIGATPGKYYYMSPEQASGAVVDLRSDIFSAGIVLYEMVTGEMLYFDEDLMTVAENARAANIAPPTQIRGDTPLELERIVMRALAKRPADRYQTADELAEDLGRYLTVHAPGFTQTRLAALVAQVGGEPEPVPVTAPAPRRAVPTSTRRLTVNDLVHDVTELHDEHSVLGPLPHIPVTLGARDFNELTRPLLDADTDRTDKFGGDTPTTHAELPDPVTRPHGQPAHRDRGGDRVVMAVPVTPVTPVPGTLEGDKTIVRPSTSRARTELGPGATPELKPSRSPTRPSVPKLDERPWYQRPSANQVPDDARHAVYPPHHFQQMTRQAVATPKRPMTWRYVAIVALIAMCLGFLLAYR